MIEFSLERMSEKIHFGKTKDYFAEVSSSYQIGNYRSAVVTLWSVAVCDIVLKLQHLLDLYSDTHAANILKDIEKEQVDNPRSSTWEMTLIDTVFTTTNLIDHAECENLKYLQKQRHLCAHPILNNNSELQTPNKETVRSLIRNTLEGLLVKPPFYTQVIFDELLKDVSDTKHALKGEGKLKTFVENRYLNRLTVDAELSIFRSLWKLVFKLDNDDCEKNRQINFQILEIISQRNIGELPKTVLGESDYYGNIASKGLALSYLVFYLAKYPNLYEHLPDDTKLKVQHCIETDTIGRTSGWFIKDSLEVHFDDIIQWIEGPTKPTLLEGQLSSLLEISDTKEWQDASCKIIGTYYAQSGNFDKADIRFSNELEPHLNLFNIQAFEYLLPKIESNNQVYGRGRASLDHMKIKTAILKIEEGFDFSPYPIFLSATAGGEE